MKNIALALGGGAARGFVHIGILKYLEEKNIHIEEIAGTSMGAIIASFVAIGKDSEYIKKFAQDINYLTLFDFDLKLGFIKGNKIFKLLEKEFHNLYIEDTEIPLKIVATDIENGISEVFTKGRIVDAIRASVSLPGVFAPYELNGKMYVDGGILMNLPIEALEHKNILAVSALKIVSGKIIKNKKILGFEFKTGFWRNNYEIIKRTIVDMMNVNEKRSLQTIGKEIIFIQPDFGKLDMQDFDKVDEFVQLGYNSLKNKLK